MATRLLEDLHLALASSESAIIRWLVRVTAFFGATHVAMVAVVAVVGRDGLHLLRLNALVDQFYLDAEQNLPTYFSCAILAFAGALLLLIAHRVQADGEPRQRHWRALSWIFFCMSVDEFVSFHERLGEFIRIHFHGPEHGLLRFTWVVVGIPFVVIVGSLYLPFLLALPRRIGNLMMLSGFLYVSGALLMEMFDGWYVGRYGDNTVYKLLSGVEDLLEMAGVILFIQCLLRMEGVFAVRRTADKKRPAERSLHPRASTRLNQNASRSPNRRVRCGDVTVLMVLVITMKFDGVVAVAFGLLSAGVFVKFSASARNWRFTRLGDVEPPEESEVHVEQSADRAARSAPCCRSAPRGPSRTRSDRRTERPCRRRRTAGRRPGSGPLPACSAAHSTTSRPCPR